MQNISPCYKFRMLINTLFMCKVKVGDALKGYCIENIADEEGRLYFYIFRKDSPTKDEKINATSMSSSISQTHTGLPLSANSVTSIPPEHKNGRQKSHYRARNQREIHCIIYLLSLTLVRLSYLFTPGKEQTVRSFTYFLFH